MKHSILLSLLLVGLTVHAQNSEYLVKQTGDTLYGKNISLVNKQFTVESASGTSMMVSAQDVKTVHSKNFRFSTVVPCKLQVYSDNLSDLEQNHYKTLVKDTVLIIDEVYSTPKMNLYWGLDDLKKQYYFYKTPEDPLPIQLYINYMISGELGQSLSLIKANSAGSTHLEIQKGYVNQLRLIMGDCKKITDADWETLDYRIYSLKSVIKKYSKCK